MFTVGAFVNGRPYMAQVRNFQLKPQKLIDEFQTHARYVPEGVASHFPLLLDKKDENALVRISQRRPSKPEDYATLLASMNKRVASRHPTVSAHCVTSFVPPTGPPIRQKAHYRPKDVSDAAQSLTVPFLLLGVDTSELVRTISTNVTARISIEEASRNSVEPRNRLRRQ